MAPVSIDYDDPHWEQELNLAFEYDDQYIAVTADSIVYRLTGE